MSFIARLTKLFIYLALFALLAITSCSYLNLRPADVATAPAAFHPPTPPPPTMEPVAPTNMPATTAPTPVFTLTPPPDTGWQPVQPGLERRLIKIFDDGGGLRETLYLLRFEPDQFEFGVGYQPGNPQSLTAWQQKTGALMVVNGGYFTPEFLATGLVIDNGQVHGDSFQGFGGMFAVGPDGPMLRSLVEVPHNPDEVLNYALQSFPLLILPGGQQGIFSDNHIPARRTVIARDRDHRLLFVLAQWGSFTLGEMSQYLLNSDLDLDIALNLDGGASSGILLDVNSEGVPAYTLLPTVIIVHNRSSGDGRQEQ